MNIFLQVSKSIRMKISTLPWPADLLKQTLTVYRTIYMQGRELYSGEFLKIYI